MLLTEHRSVRWRSVDAEVWQLSWESALSADRPVELGSPGSKGRAAAGYGGFFWRFASCRQVEVHTAEARGEADVNGTVAPWIAWSADFTAGPGCCGPATVVVAAPEAASAGEPWFVRVEGYPGLGSALAWDRARLLEPGRPLVRRFDVAIADGRRTAEECRRLATDLIEQPPR